MEELLKQLFELMEKNRQKQKIVIIETSSHLYHDKIFSTLKKYYNQLDISIWPSTEYGNESHKQLETGIIIPNQETLMSMIKEANLILILSFSRDLLVKGALCMSDTSSSYALQVAIMQQKLIIAVDSGINLKLEHWKLQDLDKNEAYNQSLNLFREKLVDFGVQFTTIFEFSDIFTQWITRYPSFKPSDGESCLKQCTKTLTYQDVIGKHEITLTRNTKLTELAQDYVRDNKIVVKNRE